MPVCMDRHDMPGTTAKAVADAHEKDLKLQSKYGVKLMTYWFDEQRGSTFCLMEAPAAERVKELHAEAHGAIPHTIVEVNPELVNAFLGRIEDPISPSGFHGASSDSAMDSAFRAIMFTDMKGSTAITSQMGDLEALEFFRTHNAITRDVLRMHNGREIQHTGDGVMASFTAASSAVACAVSIHQAFAEYNDKHSEAEIKVRIGISAGEPIEEDNRLFGSSVQLASRLCDHAHADQILVAPVVKELCLGKGFDFTDQGEVPFKGFDTSQRVYEVTWQSGPTP